MTQNGIFRKFRNKINDKKFFKKIHIFNDPKDHLSPPLNIFSKSKNRKPNLPLFRIEYDQNFKWNMVIPP